MEILVNGRRAGAKPITAGSKPIDASAKPIPVSHTISVDFNALVPLPPGERSVTLKAIAYDDEGLQGWEEIRLTRRATAAVQGNLYVLAIGVSKYRNPKYNLKYAAADAVAFGDFWKATEGTLYRKVNVTRVTDEQATAANVREALVRIAATATEKDSVGLFVSGHGVQVEKRDFYFATHDIEPDRPEQTGLPWTAFINTLSKLDAKRVFLFLDACHSGNALGGQQASNVRLAGELLRRNAGVVVFASSRGTEFSYEMDDLKHGAFTEALVEGLRDGKADLDAGGGKDGTVNVEELLTYLRFRVPKLTGNMQIPTCPCSGTSGSHFRCSGGKQV